ncbi:unnamed protein product [Aureobasidium uvarum]|uniref:SRP9 domain-containing protein n=1 Tax=Aureobasidium uvarum TaxID=2773716 RepID=A0A9N8PNF4_9PEZI|nr:unnamed protein product [Aureobasidium uvarum]
MPYFTSSEEWQRQSALLLQAHAAATEPKPIVALLELKTYDPVSGTTLKYKTDKAAEVGRLIAAMGTLGREMAALPEKKEDVIMADAGAEGTETLVEAAAPAAQNTAPKKKKKGKK